MFMLVITPIVMLLLITLTIIIIIIIIIIIMSIIIFLSIRINNNNNNHNNEDWMNQNFLRLNDNKTNIIIIFSFTTLFKTPEIQQHYR